MNAYIFIMTTGRLFDDRTMTTDRFRRNSKSIRFKAANVVSTNPLTPHPPHPPLIKCLSTYRYKHEDTIWSTQLALVRLHAEEQPLILQQQLSQILCAPLPMPYRLPHPDQILHCFTTCIPFLCVPGIFLPTPN